MRDNKLRGFAALEVARPLLVELKHVSWQRTIWMAIAAASLAERGSWFIAAFTGLLTAFFAYDSYRIGRALRSAA